MSSAGYRRECEQAEADAATKLHLTAQAKLKAVEPEVVAAVPPGEQAIATANLTHAEPMSISMSQLPTICAERRTPHACEWNERSGRME
jgi:hypothetical protein